MNYIIHNKLIKKTNFYLIFYLNEDISYVVRRNPESQKSIFAESPNLVHQTIKVVV